jgi:hypothetical protein
MHIFIDESGTFTRSAGPESISMVGALIMPDERLPFIEAKYKVIRANLPKRDGEVKGRLLSAHHIDRVVTMLSKNEVIYEAEAIDLGMHQDADILRHQAEQAEAITFHLTEKHQPSMIEQIWDLRHRLEEMPAQLYVQSILSFLLIKRAIDHGTLYFVHRRPRELAAFHWTIDAKGRGNITNWERWWSLVVMPFMQSLSIREPMMRVAGEDYSHLSRFIMPTPAFLRSHLDEEGDPKDCLDFRMMMKEDFRFSSQVEPGLEMVDILVNATRRALVGNLGFAGWRNIPRLMIHRPKHYIRISSLLKHSPIPRRYSYMPVLKYFSRGGKDMLVPRLRHRRRP